MKKHPVLISYSLFFIIVVAFIVWLYYPTSTPPPQQTSQSIRTVEQLELTLDGNNTKPVSIEASKLPEFVYELPDAKFDTILKAGKSVKDYVKASIVHSTYANEAITTDIRVDEQKRKLVVHPNDIPNFTPGKYKLHLTLRTLEGEVNIDQDFRWGVLAFNTHKSIYKPGETARIGIGVLNDKGETQCMTGIDKVDEVTMHITDPSGAVTNFSTKDTSIADSGKCGPITVTNEADFQAAFPTTTTGIYQVKVVATLMGEQREIEDYFKVAEDIPFDIERTSFPTRIYPRALYPTTLTITAKTAYSGTVVDIVPASFVIENISDNGTIESEGDFIRIIWKTHLTAGEQKTFSYFIKFPRISPEFYLIGPLQIGGFKEARQWQVASDAINSTSGLITYEDNGSSNTWARVWTGTAFNAQISMDNTPADSRWFVEKSSPKTGEKLVAAFDNNNDGNRILYMFRWDGSGWFQDFTADPASNWPDGNTRVMDVAYEEESGEALVVYGDNTTQLKYRHRAGTSGGSWTAESNAGTALDSRKRWVKTKGQFGSDSILVGYLNDNSRIGALIWDGSTNTFQSQFEDDDSPAQTETVTDDEEAFDIAWETNSGTPMIFWGTAANTVLSREFSSGAWQAENTVYNTGFTGDIEWLLASSDPASSSNYIALAMQESDSDTTNEVSDCEFGIWDGSAGVTRPTAVSCRGDFVGRLISTAFENTGSRAVWFYGISESGTTGNTPAYRTWTSGGGFTASSTLTGDLSGNIESVQLHADLNTTSMLGLTVDSAGDLNHYEWDGSSWTGLATDVFSNIQGTGENAEAYGFGFDRNLETQVAYRWFANTNGTSVSTALTSQDTPYTLTTASQAFRLRLLLYTPDTLTVSLRNYKLQYVDPGTGTCAAPTSGTPSTWTDVPSSGGSTISFNDNATPVDGANLTTNGSLDPTYRGLTIVAQDYEEANNFTNTVAQINGEQLGLWDFSLIDNTTFDRIAQTYCFRVTRSNNIVLQIGVYPQIATAALPDVLIQGGTLIRGGVRSNN